jgi:hypothetical protein
MKRLSLFPLALLVVLSACTPKAPPPPVELPPAPPSAEELHKGIMTALQPYFIPIDALPTPAIQALRAEATQTLRTECNKIGSAVNRDLAKSKVKSDLMGMLKMAYDSEEWNKTLLFCDLFDILDSDTVRTKRYRVRAETEKNRPKPTVTGIVTDPRTDIPTVFMDVYLPETDTTEQVRVRIGEDFFGLRLLEIIGRNTAVKFLYIETDTTYEVPGPKRQ